MSLLRLEGLRCRYPVSHDVLGRPERWVHALDEVSLALDAGEALGVLGESGSGKSTLARALVGLEPFDAGQLHFDGLAVDPASRRDWQRLRRGVQLVFQDADRALHPTRRIGDALAEVLRVHRVVPRAQLSRRVDALLEQVGLRPGHAGRRPHELSSGQRQRAGVARALAVQPRILVADEPVSSLDPSLRAQVLNLLLDLREQRGLGLLLMGHDLGMMEAVCDRVLVLLNGKVVERLPVAQLRHGARHPYTRALVAAWPAPDPALRPAPDSPSQSPPPAAEPLTAFEALRSCPFVPRCPRARTACSQSFPPPLSFGPQHEVACLDPHAALDPHEPKEPRP